MAELIVALHGETLGRLRGGGSDFDFTPAPEAVRTWGLNSRVLSVAVPLLPRPPASGRAIRKNFFAELLPEGDARARLANQARVRVDDILGLLAVFGRDVAGAVQIWDADAPGEPRTPAIESLDDAGVRQMLENVEVAPLGNKPRRGKTSLNGVQPKIVLVQTEDGWARALDGWPSTHIVKPIVPRYPSMIFDEEYGSRFARALGLASFSTELRVFDGATALVIERYDRDPSAADGRVHQEDFNQALGLAGEQKYEMFGARGVADISRIVGPGTEDASRVLQMLTLSVAVGNLDLHMKNFSLLHPGSDAVRLAPMYDVVPQHFYDNDGEMALRIGGEFEHRLLTRGHLEAAGAELGVADAARVVSDTLTAVRDVAEAERPHAGATPGLRRMIQDMTANLLAGLTTAGESGASTEPRAAWPATGGWRWDNPRKQ